MGVSEPPMVDLNGCRSGCRGVLGSNGTDENIFRRGPDPAVSCAEWGELEDVGMHLAFSCSMTTHPPVEYEPSS